MNRFRFLLAVTLITSLLTATPSPWTPAASAHGGVIIDGGFTDHYEWIAMASPFPVTPGETILTVLIYDIETYAPINGLIPTLELAPPNTPRPCCEGDGILGPLPLLVDPILYPGDYSNITLLLREGSWQGRFTIDADDPVGPGELTEIFFNVDVRKAQEGEVRPTPVDAPAIAQTATTIALNPDEEPEPVATSEESYPEPVAPIEPANAAGEAGEESQEAEETGDADTGDADTGDTETGAAETGDAAAGEGSEETAMSTPYPPPPAPEENAAQAESTPDSSSDESTDSVSFSAGAAELPANQEQPGSGSGSSWAIQNLWLLAALALVPLLLVIVWFLLSNNNEDNEWSGDPEE